MARSRFSTPLVAVCGVQLVIGAVGLALFSGDGGDGTNVGVNVSQPGQTTTSVLPGFVLGDPQADGSSTTVAGGAPGDTTSIAPVTVGGSTTTTAPKATTTTKALPPKKPGAQGIQKIGSYTFEATATKEDGSSDTSNTTTQVSDGGSPGGVPHRIVKGGAGDDSGFSSTNTIGFRPEGLYVEKTVVEASGSTLECTWNPAFPIYVAPLQVGTTWTYSSVCTGTFKGGQLDGTSARIDNKGTNKVTGSDTQAVAGTAYGTWIITGSNDVDITFTSGLANGQAVKTHTDQVDHYSPELSIPMLKDATTTVTPPPITKASPQTVKSKTVLKTVP